LSIKSKVFAAVAALTLIGGVAGAGATTAWAVPTIAKVSNTAIGEAGYYINDNGETRIRDVQATTVVTSTMENLNGTGAGTAGGPPQKPGGVGTELCNDNTGYAAQAGLEWVDAAGSTPGHFVLEYNYTGNPGYGGPGDVLTATSTSDPDPCAEGGLLNNGTGELFLNDFTPQVGDVLHFEIYYDPKGKFFHSLKFLVQDQTQDLTRVQTADIPAENFYEAGIGVVTQAANLTGGAVNLINTFTGAFFNWYKNGYGSKYAPVGILQPSHWDLEMADFVNGSNQVTLTPSNLTGVNNSFAMLEGSTSA